ncbi:MAG: phosphate ABC transporter permease PstA [Thermomicrobiales bacterium]
MAMVAQQYGQFTPKVMRRRRIVNLMMIGVFSACAIVILIPLVHILTYSLIKGASSLNLHFFTKPPQPPGQPGGGVATALVGSGIILAMASAIGIPTGILAGVYLAEYGNRNAFAMTVRFVADILLGVPSIVIGVFIWTLLVRPFHSFSAIAGGVALAVMMIPTIARTTEEVVRLVPGTLREASLALGIPYWKTVLRITVPAARSGIGTAVVLAFARVGGETAPLLFTALGNNFFQRDVRRPIDALPLRLFNYAIGPYDEWHRIAWASAFVLVFFILMLMILIRRIARGKFTNVV